MTAVGMLWIALGVEAVVVVAAAVWIAYHFPGDHHDEADR